MAGGYRRRVGESLPGWRASSSRLCRKHGPRDEEAAAAERPKGAFLLPRCAFRRSASPSSFRGRGSPNLPLTQIDLPAAMTLAPTKEHAMKGKREQQSPPEDIERFRIELARKLDGLVADNIGGWRRCDRSEEHTSELQSRQ